MRDQRNTPYRTLPLTSSRITFPSLPFFPGFPIHTLPSNSEAATQSAINGKILMKDHITALAAAFCTSSLVAGVSPLRVFRFVGACVLKDWSPLLGTMCRRASPNLFEKTEPIMEMLIVPPNGIIKDISERTLERRVGQM